MNLQTLLQQLQAVAVASYHRRLLVLSGPADWCRQQATELITPDVLWIGEHAPAGTRSLPNQQCHNILGQTLQRLIYDAWDGFNPNAFGQVSGALAGGGVLILLCPPLEHWPDYDDPEHQSLVVEPYSRDKVGRRFIGRLCRVMMQDPWVLIVRHDQPLPTDIAVRTTASESSEKIIHDEPAPPCITCDQQQAVELIIRQLNRGRRPAVLTSDRGRGKSTALGIAAAQLCGLGNREIFLTGPDRNAVSAALDMAAQLLPQARYEHDSVISPQGSIRFLQPELALQQSGEGRILLVDEAAAIPVSMLRRLLAHYPRIAFASTIHGYEGTGQGFAIRFRKLLMQETPHWKAFHLSQPVRWESGDPLETLVFRILLLDAEPPTDSGLQASVGQARISIARLDRQQLAKQDAALSQLFGLLVLAHYRTTPGDLRILLDSPNLYIWQLCYDNQIAGALLVADEGPLPVDLVDAIWSGQRRPRGHLLPQTLVGQEGYRPAAGLRAGRIMRLVVHPSLHRQGLGSRLLRAVQAAAPAMGWDYIGTSFALNEELLSFWQQNGYQLARLGTTRDSVSGCYAALMLQPVSHAGAAMMERLQKRFARQFGFRLSDDLQQLEPELAAAVLALVDAPEPLEEDDYSDLSGFVHHNRSYESTAYALQKLLRLVLIRVPAEQRQVLMHNPDLTLLLQRTLQRLGWQALGVDGQGRRTQVRRLREAAGLLLELLDEHPTFVEQTVSDSQ